MSTDRRRAASRAALAAATTAALLLTSAACTQSSGTENTNETYHPASPTAQDHGDHRAIILADAADRLPSSSARDWVTYADHVIAVRITAERETEPAQEELERGEGLINRRLSFAVTRVLWSAPEAPPPPTSFDSLEFGWQFRDGSTQNRVPMGVRGASRYELGHDYVMAVQWVPTDCAVPTVGTWEELGSDSSIPFDGGTLGHGEFEGRMVDPVDLENISGQPGEGTGLRTSLAGQGRQSLVRLLAATRPATSAAILADANPC